MKLNPYLTFGGNCREAFEFYKECLGGELKLTTVEQGGMAEQMPAKKDQIMHAELKSGEMTLMGSDMIMDGNVEPGNIVSIAITDGSKEEIEAVMNKIAEGGKIRAPFSETSFGYYGDLQDKYGFYWMFQSDKSE